MLACGAKVYIYKVKSKKCPVEPMGLEPMSCPAINNNHSQA